MITMEKIGWTFLIGGALGALAQAIFNIYSVTIANSELPIAATLGPDTLVTMALIGGITGGLGLYRHLDGKSPIGAAIPFSGFAFGVGECMIGPWTKWEPDGYWKCFWQGLWLIIWYNALVFAVTLGLAALFYFPLGIHGLTATPIQPMETPTSGVALYLTAFFTSGTLCVLWQLFSAATKISSAWLLVVVWLAGAILGPTGLLLWIESFGGWGFNVLVFGAGQSLLSIYFAIFSGAPGAWAELGIILATIGLLFLTGWLCFTIHILRFGHRVQGDERIYIEEGKPIPETIILDNEFWNIGIMESVSTTYYNPISDILNHKNNYERYEKNFWNMGIDRKLRRRTD